MTLCGEPLDGMARERLAWLLDPAAAELLMRSLLDELGLECLESAEHLCRFGQALLRRGGDVAEIIGPLLVLHGRALGGAP